MVINIISTSSWLLVGFVLDRADRAECLSGQLIVGRWTSISMMSTTKWLAPPATATIVGSSGQLVYLLGLFVECYWQTARSSSFCLRAPLTEAPEEFHRSSLPPLLIDWALKLRIDHLCVSSTGDGLGLGSRRSLGSLDALKGGTSC